jgi:hypothetical protein
MPPLLFFLRIMNDVKSHSCRIREQLNHKYKAKQVPESLALPSFLAAFDASKT